MRYANGKFGMRMVRVLDGGVKRRKHAKRKSKKRSTRYVRVTVYVKRRKRR